jgi:hypothetical protein
MQIAAEAEEQSFWTFTIQSYNTWHQLTGYSKLSPIVVCLSYSQPS